VDHAPQVVCSVEGLSIDLHDDVMGLQTSLTRRSVVVDHNNLGSMPLLQVQRRNLLVSDVAKPNAKIAGDTFMPPDTSAQLRNPSIRTGNRQEKQHDGKH
jgi:hypothetical protein